MIASRYASTHVKNPQLVHVAQGNATGNVAWLGAVKAKSGVILLGGTSLADFRIRVAQSQLRWEMTPSCWSIAGILCAGKITTVPLGGFADVSAVPLSNGIVELPVGAFDDVAAWPNIAVIRFAKDPDAVMAEVPRVKEQRSIVDIPTLITAWLSFIWATRDSRNPLTEGVGVPSAAFVETVYAVHEVGLSPSLASSASCPEAIWQSARYWYEFFDATSKAPRTKVVHPTGSYRVSQPSAMVALPPHLSSGSSPRAPRHKPPRDGTKASRKKGRAR